MAQIIHKRIAKVAKAIAYECYEVMAHEDDFYRLNPDQDGYVRRNWKHYIPFARQSVVQILSKDYDHEIGLGVYTREGVAQMKDEVYEALLIDGSAKGKPRKPPPEILRLRERFGTLN